MLCAAKVRFLYTGHSLALPVSHPTLPCSVSRSTHLPPPNPSPPTPSSYRMTRAPFRVLAPAAGHGGPAAARPRLLRHLRRRRAARLPRGGGGADLHRQRGGVVQVGGEGRPGRGDQAAPAVCKHLALVNPVNLVFLWCASFAVRFEGAGQWPNGHTHPVGSPAAWGNQYGGWYSNCNCR